MSGFGARVVSHCDVYVVESVDVHSLLLQKHGNEGGRQLVYSHSVDSFCPDRAPVISHVVDELFFFIFFLAIKLA